jgi:hypothetical protein
MADNVFSKIINVITEQEKIVKSIAEKIGKLESLGGGSSGDSTVDDTTIQNILSTLRDHKVSIEVLNEQVANLEAISIEGSLQDLNTLIQSIQNTINALDTRVTNLENRMNNLSGFNVIEDYVSGKTYNRNDMVIDPDTEIVYRVLNQYTSANLSTDLSNGQLKIVGFDSPQIVTFDHNPTQSEIDVLPNDALVVVYSSNDAAYSAPIDS